MKTNLQKKTAMQEIPLGLRPCAKVWRITRKAYAETITAHALNENWSGRMLAAAEDSLAKGDAGSAIGYAGAATCYVREAGAAARRCAAFAKEARGISRMTGNPLDGCAARDAWQWTVNARRCAAEARGILPRCRDIIRQAQANLAKTEKRIAQLQKHCVVEKGTGKVDIYQVSQGKKVDALVKGGKFRRLTRTEVLGTFKATLEEHVERAQKAVTA